MTSRQPIWARRIKDGKSWWRTARRPASAPAALEEAMAQLWQPGRPGPGRIWPVPSGHRHGRNYEGADGEISELTVAHALGGRFSS